MKLAVDLDAVLGDTRPLWDDWLADVGRRVAIDVGRLPDDRAAAAGELDGLLGNWRSLLERFSEERAPVYLRPAADVSATLRRLQAGGAQVGVYTDAPEELARVALAQLGATRRVEGLEAGVGALERLLARLGPGTRVVRTRAELTALA